MTVENKTQIKTYFETNDYPTQAEFGNLIDSYYDYSDGVSLSSQLLSLSGGYDTRINTISSDLDTLELNFGGLSTLIQANSGGWESVETTVQSNSANWNYQGTDLKALSAGWSSAQTVVNNTSAVWNDTSSTVQANSATTWNYQGTDLKALSAGWVGGNSAYTTVQSNSGNWNSVYTTVQANSATTWNYQGTDLKALSAGWVGGNSAYTTVQANSAGWEGTETTVQANSANWSNWASVSGGYALLNGTNMPFTSATITGNLVVDTNTLFVDAGNNRVGIGTSSPSYDLQVGDGTGSKTAYILGGLSAVNPVYGGRLTVGNANYVGQLGNINQIVGGDTGTNDIYLQSTYSDLRIGTESAKAIGFVTNGWSSTRMIITSGGNIGMGTLVPASKLDIVGATSDTLRIGNVNQSYKIGRNTVDGLLDIEGSQAGYTGYNFKDAGGTSRLYIKSDGNVGIGTATPASKFHINNYATAVDVPYVYYNTAPVAPTGFVYSTLDDTTTFGKPADVTLFNKSSSAGSSLEIAFAGYNTSDPVSYAAIKSIFNGAPGGYIGGDLSFLTRGNASNVMSQRMIIKSDGNVGIGTSAPNYKLDVNGTSNFTDTMYFPKDKWLLSNPDGQNRIYFTGDGSTRIQGAGTGVQHIFSAGDGTTIISTVSTSNGNNVGIGTTTPAAKLDVVGTARFGDSATNYTSFESTGTLVSVGSAISWDDLPPTAIINAKLGSTAPTLATLVGGIEAYTFDATNDYVIGATELTHAYKEGTTIMPHIHWATNGLEGSDKTVKWNLEYSIANGGTGAFTTSTSLSAENVIPANTTDRTHYINNFSPTIAGTGIKIGAYITWKLSRVTSSGTAPSADPFALAVGFHVQQDTLGSRGMTTK